MSYRDEDAEMVLKELRRQADLYDIECSMWSTKGPVFHVALPNGDYFTSKSPGKIIDWLTGEE